MLVGLAHAGCATKADRLTEVLASNWRLYYGAVAAQIIEHRLPRRRHRAADR